MHLDTQHVSWLPAGWSKGLLVDVVICRWRECPGLMAKKTGCYVRPQAPSSLGPIMCEILDQQDHPDLGSLCALVLFSVITGNKIILFYLWNGDGWIIHHFDISTTIHNNEVIAGTVQYQPSTNPLPH